MSEAEPRIVRRVTAKHAAWFASTWRELQPDNGGTMYDAFRVTHIVKWPDRDALASRTTPAQECYFTLEEAVLRRTAELVEGAIGRAFLRAATEVLDRERARRRRGVRP